VPVVKEGDAVKKGDIIADIPEGRLGARVHSSIDGKVAKVKADQVVIKK
jgi:Na+-translocating ferredoxin:NAD+ oxidoreductase RnfC subunit